MVQKKSKTPSSIYLMHKYWGKKPSEELNHVIEKYSKKNSTILDPFAGYGGVGIEGVLLNRNVILNDLNPVSNFINECILNIDINFDIFNQYYEELRKSYYEQEHKWYYYKNKKIYTILRDKNDKPLKIKVKNELTKKLEEITLTQTESKLMLEEENNFKIKTWYPDNYLIPNSRLSIKDNMRICDLFSKRELICQSALFDFIDQLPENNEKKLFKFAFTANVANCSKLVPPISSRGEMAQGAWMTGFYIGETYLENNVFHYFESRVEKTKKGKKDFIDLYNKNKKNGSYKILNNDAKNLNIESNSIDLVFTDFPYGDTVPYFEQSQLWNSWLKSTVDYENEIVISNSNVRNKDSNNFEKDIDKAVSEISRVLRNQSYFVFTFHSLNGEEWKTISNALIKYNFEFVDCNMLMQKTFTPRQLNRRITIKGDIIAVYKKSKNQQLKLDLEKVEYNITKELKEIDSTKLYDTNSLILVCIKSLLKTAQISNHINFIELVEKYFKIDEKVPNMWRIKNEI